MSHSISSGHPRIQKIPRTSSDVEDESQEQIHQDMVPIKAPTQFGPCCHVLVPLWEHTHLGNFQRLNLLKTVSLQFNKRSTMKSSSGRTGEYTAALYKIRHNARSIRELFTIKKPKLVINVLTPHTLFRQASLRKRRRLCLSQLSTAAKDSFQSSAVGLLTCNQC